MLRWLSQKPFKMHQQNLHKKDFKEFLNCDNDFEISVKDFIRKSKAFPVQFPVKSNLMENLLRGISVNPYQQGLRNKGKTFDETLASKYINSTYPVVHEKLLPLLVSFLECKKQSDQSVERKFYSKKTTFDLVGKLLKNRPVVFMSPADNYRLLDNTGGFGGFEKIGRDSNKDPKMVLKDLNSYDEMRLAALVSVSSHSYFINKGDRGNCAKQGNGADHEVEGVIVGQVGARFENEGYMDWLDCALVKSENVSKKGYGPDGKGHRKDLLKAWAQLWGEDYLPEVEDLKNCSEKYEKILGSGHYLNKAIYKQRIKHTAEVLLIEASARAAADNLKAYVHIVGLGLGVWMLSRAQTNVYVEAFLEAVQNLSDTLKFGISFMDFSYINYTGDNIKNGDKIPGTDITVKFSKRSLHDKVPKECLLVCNFAWDSNSLPGNEYWNGCLSASGDPAAACSSGVAELHNVHINDRVCAATLRVASPQYGILPVKDYLEKVTSTE